jgi:hypothetical protein
MWKDEIVEETRKIRDNHARKFNYDLKAIYLALKEEERKSGMEFVSPPRKRKTQAK